MIRSLAAVLIIVWASLSSPAFADVAVATFESKALGAKRIDKLDEAVWSLIAACDRGDDVQQRQCRLLRDVRAKATLGATLLVEADPDAFTVGEWSTAKKSVSLKLTSCVRCKTPMRVEGTSWRIAGPAPVLYDNAHQFSDESTAKAWLKTLKDARVEMVIKMPDRKLLPGKGAAQGSVTVDVLAYRVITPCTGEIAIASPSSANVAPDAKACGPAVRAPRSR